MIRALVQIILNGIALWLASYLVAGVTYSGDLIYLLLAGLVLGLVNLLVKPLVTLFSFPLIIVTLGLFFLVINAGMLMLTAVLLSGLEVHGCGSAVLGGLVIAVFNWSMGAFVKDD